MWHATWAGENDPAKAIALAEAAAPGGEPEDDTGDDSDDATGRRRMTTRMTTRSRHLRRHRSRQKARKQPTGRDKALVIIKRNPGLSDAAVAKRADVSVRTVQRAREAMERKTS